MTEQKALCCDENVANYLTELCQALVARTGHTEVYDTEPRTEFQCLFRGEVRGRPYVLTNHSGFQMFTEAGNDACARAFALICSRPDLVNMFGLNRPLFRQMKAEILSGVIELANEPVVHSLGDE